MMLETVLISVAGILGLLPIILIGFFAILGGLMLDSKWQTQFPGSPHYRLGYMFSLYQLIKAILLVLIFTAGTILSAGFIDKVVDGFAFEGILGFFLDLSAASLKFAMILAVFIFAGLDVILGYFALKRSKIAFILLTLVTFNPVIIFINAVYILYMYTLDKDYAIRFSFEKGQEAALSTNTPTSNAHNTKKD